MTDIVLYGIPNCDQVKKARAWLAAHDLPHQFHDFKKAGASAELIAAWADAVGLDTVLNRKGTTWRGLPEERRAAAAERAAAIALMAEAPSLIKRPVLAADGRIHVGFSEAAYQQIFQD